MDLKRYQRVNCELYEISHLICDLFSPYLLYTFPRYEYLINCRNVSVIPTVKATYESLTI